MVAYDRDFHAWTVEQAEAIRRRSSNELDWDNLAEEIESLGRQQRWELYNRLVVLTAHLLKWSAQPGLRSRSWMAMIRVQRRDLAKLIDGAPSLKAAVETEYADAYVSARLSAAGETHLPEDGFPAKPPFNVDQALDPEWWPGVR